MRKTRERVLVLEAFVVEVESAHSGGESDIGAGRGHLCSVPVHNSQPGGKDGTAKGRVGPGFNV